MVEIIHMQLHAKLISTENMHILIYKTGSGLLQYMYSNYYYICNLRRGCSRVLAKQLLLKNGQLITAYQFNRHGPAQLQRMHQLYPAICQLSQWGLTVAAIAHLANQMP